MRLTRINLNIFFNELRNKTLSGNNVDIEDIINKANGNKDFIWKGNKKLGKKCAHNFIPTSTVDAVTSDSEVYSHNFFQLFNNTSSECSG